RLCMALVDLFRIIHWVLRPLVWLTERFAAMLLRWGGGARFTGHLFGNRDELRFVIQESGQGLTSEERVMINRVLDLQTLTVGQIMVPMERAVTVSASTPVPRLLERARERGLNRLPVWSESAPRRVIGLVSVRSLLYDGGLDSARTAGSVLRPAQFLSHDLRLEVALRQMQRAGQRLAVVLGPDRTEVGLLSLEDILRVIFGEVRL
ncbi:MAG TPA: CBS domain-containing protein, partial [Methylomirabilota bacterium]|nr:CBS domain-containing protein [Methylomirabilota bacterium]